MSTTRTLITTISLTVLLSATAIEAQPSVIAGGSSDVMTSTTEALSLDETRETPTDVADQRYRVEFLDATVTYTTVDQLVETMSVLRVFRESGLDLPHVTIEYFTSDECTVAGSMWTDSSGEFHIKVCAGRRTLLHELGHVWDNEHLTDGERARLLEIRNLDHWGGVDWELCGGEHLAETIAWALDDSTLPVYRIRDNSYEQLGAMYLLATGSTDAPIFERITGLAERSRQTLDELQSGDEGHDNGQLLDHGNDLGADQTIG